MKKKGATSLKLIREIRVSDLIKYFFVPLVFMTLLWFFFGLFAYLIPSFAIKLGVIIAISLICILLLKPFVIGAVLMYKAFAPKRMRDRCRFEPTCSTYMIMAINKYGLCKGFIKGVKRICRCKPPNGGIDYP